MFLHLIICVRGGNMEFCPECGTMLMPKEKGENMWLVCPDCDSYKKLKEEEDYRKGEEKKKGKEKEVTIVEEERKKIEQPDYDLDTDDAYSEMYNE